MEKEEEIISAGEAISSSPLCSSIQPIYGFQRVSRQNDPRWDRTDDWQKTVEERGSALSRRTAKGKRRRTIERKDRKANEKSHKLSLSGTRDEAFRPIGLAAIFDKAIRRTRKFPGTVRTEPNRPRLSRYQLATISRRHGDLILEIYLPDKLKVFSGGSSKRS